MVVIGILLTDGLLFGTVEVSVLFVTAVVRSLVVLLLPYTNFEDCLVGSTMLTRKRDDAFVVLGKNVGEQLADDGGVIGDVPSITRDTWNRLRDGLGAGDDTGDGIGLGAGDLKRPPVLRFGSKR